MTEMYKSSKEEYVAKKGLSRIGQLKWWFLVLIVIGIVALATIWIMKGGEVVGEFQKGAAYLMPISTVYAQPVAELAEDAVTPKILIMAGIFLVLGIVYIAGIYKLFFSDNSNQIEFASDLVKTLTGFFVGAATGLLG
jgi:hypothetical protein